MTNSPVHRLIELFQEAFTAMNIEVPPSACEQMGILVHSAMDNGLRKFHNTGHVFDLIEGLNPTQSLAVLFHDVVYLQVDGGLPRNTEGIFASWVKHEGTEAVLSLPESPEKSTFISIVFEIFAYEPGNKIGIFNGLNELLSACTAAWYLSPFLSEKELVTVLAAIEATIPFRSSEPAPFEQLCERIELLLQDAAEAERITKEALEVANRDVGNFAYADIGAFLDNTWRLLPETNNFLLSPGVYSITYYRTVLQKMRGFLGWLKPEQVFTSFRGYPSSEKTESLFEASAENLGLSADYLGAKLLPMIYLEALALSSGGDAPISLFLGDSRYYYDGIPRAEDSLPKLPAESADDCKPVILQLLEEGRIAPTSFDLQKSPMAAFCYRFRGETGYTQDLEAGALFYAEEISLEELRDKLDSKLLRILADACAPLVPSRREMFDRFLNTPA